MTPSQIEYCSAKALTLHSQKISQNFTDFYRFSGGVSVPLKWDLQNVVVSIGFLSPVSFRDSAIVCGGVGKTSGAVGHSGVGVPPTSCATQHAAQDDQLFSRLRVPLLQFAQHSPSLTQYPKRILLTHPPHCSETNNQANSRKIIQRCPCQNFSKVHFFYDFHQILFKMCKIFFKNVNIF